MKLLNFVMKMTIILTPIFCQNINLEQRKCRIRDTEHFRDIYIKPKSDLGTTLFQYDDEASTLLVSFCNPIPKLLLQKYNCDTSRDYRYARVETTIEKGKIIRVCANQIPFKSVTHFSYDKKSKFYSFEFNDRPEDEPLKIQFPFPNQQALVVYKRDDKAQVNLLNIKGKETDFSIEGGYLISDKIIALYIFQILFSLLLTYRFAIVSVQGVNYISIFICGYRLKFFDYFINFTLIFEVINSIFQLYKNPGTFVASLVVLILPLQSGIVVPDAISKYLFTRKCYF